MPLLIHIIIVSVLLGLFIQDMRYRAVNWHWFPVLFSAFIGLQLLEHHKVTDVIEQGLLGTFLVVCIIIFLSVYASLLKKRIVNITKGFFGWGDILMLLCIVWYFSVSYFTLFFLFTCMLIGLFMVIWCRITANRSPQIPFAGIMAVMLIFVLIGNWWIYKKDLSDNEWYFNLLWRLGII